MTRPFCYFRRFTYFDEQDRQHDYAYALMRWSGPDVAHDDFECLPHIQSVNVAFSDNDRGWYSKGYKNAHRRPDKSRRKRSRRHVRMG